MIRVFPVDLRDASQCHPGRGPVAGDPGSQRGQGSRGFNLVFWSAAREFFEQCRLIRGVVAVDAQCEFVEDLGVVQVGDDACR